MKQVWQTNDGEIFDSEEDAKQHEETYGRLEYYCNLIRKFNEEHGYDIRDDMMHDLAAFLNENKRSD
jgi:hypothetical protein